MWVQTGPNQETFLLLKDLFLPTGPRVPPPPQSVWALRCFFAVFNFFIIIISVCVTARGTHVEVRGYLCSQFTPAVIWILGLELRLPGWCGKGLYHRAVLPALGLRLYHM